MVMVISFGIVLFFVVGIRDHPEFHGLMEMDKSCWPWCLLWHGWLLLLSGVNGCSPWAESPAEGAGTCMSVLLGLILLV